MIETVVSYEGGLRCRAEHAESRTVVLTDAPKDHHGQGGSFSPSDMLSVSLGSCILSIMAIAAQSINIDIAGATATIVKEMADAPRRISAISVALCVPGDFNARQRAKLEGAAHACPVHNVLGIDVPISIDWVG
jgi:putative redox protein